MNITTSNNSSPVGSINRYSSVGTQQQNLAPCRRSASAMLTPLRKLPDAVLGFGVARFVRRPECHLGFYYPGELGNVWIGLNSEYLLTSPYVVFYLSKTLPRKTTPQRWDAFVRTDKILKRYTSDTSPYEYPSYDVMVAFLNDNNYIVEMKDVVSTLGPHLYNDIINNAIKHSVTQLKYGPDAAKYVFYTEINYSLNSGVVGEEAKMIAQMRRAFDKVHKEEYCLTAFTLTHSFRAFLASKGASP